MGKITAKSFQDLLDEIRELHDCGMVARWSCKKRESDWVATGFVRHKAHQPEPETC